MTSSALCETDLRRQLDAVAEEIGCDRLDVCGQRVVEIRAWELASGEAAGALADADARGLAARVATTLEGLVAEVNRLTRRPVSGLWRGVGDRVAQALALAGAKVGESERGLAAARAALAGETPFRNVLHVRTVLAEGRAEPMIVRNGCCLWHRVPGEAKCSTCPLLPDQDRDEALAAERAAAAEALK